VNGLNNKKLNAISSCESEPYSIKVQNVCVIVSMRTNTIHSNNSEKTTVSKNAENRSACNKVDAFFSSIYAAAESPTSSPSNSKKHRSGSSSSSSSASREMIDVGDLLSALSTEPPKAFRSWYTS